MPHISGTFQNNASPSPCSGKGAKKLKSFYVSGILSRIRLNTENKNFLDYLKHNTITKYCQYDFSNVILILIENFTIFMKIFTFIVIF